MIDDALTIRSFHNHFDEDRTIVDEGSRTGSGVVTTLERRVSYVFRTHYHPYAAELMRRLLQGSVSGLQAADTDVDGATQKPKLFANTFDAQFDPNPALVPEPHPVEELEFGTGGAYSVYNWELFFHVPLTIAMHLSRNQRFAEAQRWLHHVFDPTDDSAGETPQRFWKMQPFRTTDVRKIEEILVNLTTDADPQLRLDTVRSIEAWKDKPFRPHVIARFRHQAYMYKTVMAYLDNLIAWGDSLFRQDTGESVDEALLLYVLAANILGPRPLPVPEKGTVRPQTYANLLKDLDKFGNAVRNLEADVPFDLLAFPAEESADNARMATLRSLGKALYFCVPRNDKLLGYWDTVADRLFKIRNSLNLQGVFRQLPLFEPPIDPALLARAAAAGLDVGAIVDGLHQPLPLVRFQFLVQKAIEICQEVKSLGNNLLSAMEKEDGEAMAILRARHERVVMALVENVRYAQLQEAKKAREGLLATLALAVQRYTYYERQLGRSAEEIVIPELAELDRASLDAMRFSMRDPELAPREVPVDIAPSLNASGGKIISSHEQQEIAKLRAARESTLWAGRKEKVAAGLAMINDFGIHFAYWGVGGHTEYGGTALSKGMSLLASLDRSDAEGHSYDAGNSARINSFARREQEWAFQSNLAAGEINQIFKQLRAAEIREAIGERELANHRQQMKHAEEIERFLNEEGSEKKGKATNKALYAWMKREVKGLYAQCFQFAFDTARKAERALQHELGNPALAFVQFGYLAGKEGLLAGERLHLDIKRMEMAWHDLNQREYELTKHVSLLQTDPLALLQLRRTGRCEVALPEELFDLDGPGHYFRRIRTVSVSIPAVGGPYTSVNCTLTLRKSSIRKSPAIPEGGGYARPQDEEDDRFTDYFGSTQSIVTSSGQNDAGMFETNLRDERYLPFEGAGVISTWQLALPADPSVGEPRQFDYDTISDVLLHVRYTAREGGAGLREAAMAHFGEQLATETAAGSVRLFSIRHEFPSEWSRFASPRPEGALIPLSLPLRAEHYPFWAQGRLNHVTRVELFARSAAERIRVADTNDPAATPDELVPDAGRGKLLAATLTNIPEKPVGTMDLFFDVNAMEDLWIAVTWSS